MEIDISVELTMILGFRNHVVRMINELKIKNFKTIKSLKVRLAPLTIFVGPNGSGKTSILETIALMKQSLDLQKGLLDSLKGELVDFESPRSIFRRGIEERFLEIGFETLIDTRELCHSITEDQKKLDKFLAQEQKDLQKDFYNEIRDFLIGIFSFINTRDRQERKVTAEYAYRVANAVNSFTHTYLLGKFSLEYSVQHGNIEKGLRGAHLDILEGDRKTFLPTMAFENLPSEFLRALSRILRAELRNVYFIASDRGALPWIFQSMGSGHEWVGRKGENTLEILARLMKPEYDQKRLPYELFFEQFGMKNAWAGWDQGNALTSNFADPFLRTSLKFPSLGYGSKQLLPVIAQLAYSDPNSIILVEEPEISLHPAYQRLLPILFGRAVNENKQVLVTTHSSYFPLSLRSVFKGVEVRGLTTRGRRGYKVKLSPDQVLVYHVTRDRRGNTQVEELDIDENGLKEGIPSFIDVESEILGRYIEKE